MMNTVNAARTISTVQGAMSQHRDMLSWQFLRSNEFDPQVMSSWHSRKFISATGIMDEFSVRQEYITRFGFAIPSIEALEAISLYSPVLEIGAGSGYWSMELQRIGCNVIATDPGTGRYHTRGNGWTPFTTIEKKTATQAIKAYSGRALLTVWPDYDAPWPADALLEYKGDTVLYVGEGEGGCTGSESFHSILADDFDEVDSIAIPQFFGIHDRFMVYRRK